MFSRPSGIILFVVLFICTISLIVLHRSFAISERENNREYFLPFTDFILILSLILTLILMAVNF